MKKKLISMLVCSAALLAFVPAIAFADGEAETPENDMVYYVESTGLTYDFDLLEGEGTTAKYRVTITGQGVIPGNQSESLNNIEGFSSLAGKTTDLVIGEGITEIGENAFYWYFNYAKTITLPSTLTIIGNGAFRSNYQLTSVNIPNSVTTIGDHAFDYAQRLTTITIDTEGSNLTYIGDYAFNYCAALTTFNLPDSVTTIGDYAFYYCSNLTTFNINAEESALLSIGERAFYNDTKLATLAFPNNLQSVGVYAFYSTAFTTIDLPDSVTEIGAYAFYYMQNLTSIHISDSLTRIEDHAFACNYALETFNLPTALTYIGQNAFDGDSKLTGALVIPEGVTDIANYAFNSCRFTSLDLPDYMNSLGKGAFGSCTFTEVTIPAGITEVTGAFNNMTSLEHVYFADPDSIRVIGDSAFLGCRSLQIDPDFIPSNVTTIGRQAFDSLSQLTQINIPSRVTTIGNMAFESTGLTSIYIPASVETIGDCAFCFCHDLASVTFADGSRLNSLGSEAFRGTVFTEITIPEGVASVGNFCFHENYDLMTVYLSDLTTRLGIRCVNTELLIGTNGHRIYFLPSHDHQAIDPQAFHVTSVNSSGTEETGDLKLDNNTGLYYLHMNRYFTDYPHTYSFDYDYVDGFVCAQLVGHSLTLNSEIGVNYYMEINTDAIDAGSAYMEFSVNGKEPTRQDLDLTTLTTVNGRRNCYRFSYNVAAKEMSDRITATFHCTINGEEFSETYYYSVKQYAEYLVNHSSENSAYSSSQNVVGAMLDYGAMAQVYFNHNTANPANEVYSLGSYRSVSASSVKNYNHLGYSLPAGMSFYGASLSLESTTTLNLYFVVPEGMDLTYTVNGQQITPRIENGYTIVSIPGITALHARENVNVSISDGVNSFYASYNPMTYVYNVLSRNGGVYSSDLKNLVAAYYQFCAQAQFLFSDN